MRMRLYMMISNYVSSKDMLDNPVHLDCGKSFGVLESDLRSGKNNIEYFSPTRPQDKTDKWQLLPPPRQRGAAPTVWGCSSTCSFAPNQRQRRDAGAKPPSQRERRTFWNASSSSCDVVFSTWGELRLSHTRNGRWTTRGWLGVQTQSTSRTRDTQRQAYDA